MGSNTHTVPTVRRGSLLWYTRAQRWLHPVELAAMHAFPVHAKLAGYSGVDMDTAASEYVVGMLGNSMHVANVGCVLAIAMACLSNTP